MTSWGRPLRRPLLFGVLGYLGHEILEVLEAEPIDLAIEWAMDHVSHLWREP